MINCGFILSKFDYREQELIVRMMTKERGVVSYLIPGGKKKEGFLQFLDMIEFQELIPEQKDPNENLSEKSFVNITEICCLKSNTNRFKGVFSYLASRYICEILMKIVPYGIPEPRLFHMMNSLPVSGNLHFLQLMVRILKITGCYPDMHVCAECGSDETLAWGIVSEMQVLCSKCHLRYEQDKVRLETDFFKILEFIDKEGTGNLLISSRQFFNICSFFAGYFEINHGIEWTDYFSQTD